MLHLYAAIPGLNMNSKFVLHKWGEEDDYCLGEYNHFFHFDRYYGCCRVGCHSNDR